MIAYSVDSHQYPEFSAYIQERFNSVVGSGAPLFTTDAEGIFDLFLDNIPQDSRQHYTCNACRHFVNRYGGLVAISESGEAASAMWEESGAPEFFRNPVAAMKKAVLKAKVTGIFVSENAVLGQPVTGEWEHMSVALPQGMVHHSRLKTAGQEMAEKREEHRMLNSALQEYSAGVVDQAVTLLNSEALYRSDKVLGVAEWFKALKGQLEETEDSRVKANIKWLTVATAPAGFCHVKSGMIGTLLDDLAAGMPIDAVSRRFAEKMNPGNYMRSRVAPAQGNIQQAEKIVEKLGLADSLRRRYARFEEIPSFLWQDRGAVRKAAEEKKPGGVFANIAPKGASTADSAMMSLPSTAMTWEKFQRTVLPTAEIVEALVDNPNRFMALVTASDPTAPNILRWGNPFSWYYRRGASYDAWGMSAGKFATVRGITESPNLWGEAKAAHAGHQTFFILEGCRDSTGGLGGGLFPELLKSELHEIRSTLEAHSNATAIEDAESATACGAGYSKDGEWGLTLKVTASNSVRLVKIDRWD